MYTQITLDNFRDAFESIRPYNFSYKGLEVLFNYLDESIGIQGEANIVSLCYIFTESTIEEALSKYGLNTLEELQENAEILKVDDTTIIYTTD